MTTTKRCTILHVTEISGGGVPPVIEAISQATPDLEHVYLPVPLRRHPPANAINGAQLSPFADKYQSPWRWFSTLRSAIRYHKPTWLHLHSTVAGLMGRIALLHPRPPIIYTPHCFMFERTDLSLWQRRAFLAGERTLLHRTSAIYGVSDHEADALRTAARLHGVRIVAGFNPIPPGEVPATVRKNAGPLRIGTVGRVTAQKDPDFFLSVVRHVRDIVSKDTVSWTWIGDGDASTVQRLEDAGVDVTGWVTRRGVYERLRALDVYVHTAAWEGFPVSLSEVLGFGVPMVVRKIPTLPGVFLPFAAETPQELAARTAGLLDHNRRCDTAAQTLQIAKRLRVEDLSPILYSLYQGEGIAR